MIPVELAALMGGGFTGFGFMFGRIFEARRRRTVHEHIWGMWEECDVRATDWVDGTRQSIKVEGQQRDCASCGYRQLREVKE